MSGLKVVLLGLIFLGSSPPQSDIYVGHAYSEENGRVCFDLPEGLVDWTTLAKKTLGKKFDQPDKNSTWEGQSLLYPAPVPRQVSSKVWRILHPGGILTLQPKMLKGRVTYQLSRSFQVLSPPRAWGGACGSVDPGSVRAAFVIGAEGGEWSSEPATWSSEKNGRFVIESSGGRYTFSPPDFAVSRLKKLLVFRSAELPPRALAVWDSDPNCEALCCESAFSLYELGPKGKLATLGENGYGCDV